MMATPEDPPSADEQEQTARIGAAFEAAGLMAQGDYVRLARLSKDVVSNGGIPSPFRNRLNVVENMLDAWLCIQGPLVD